MPGPGLYWASTNQYSQRIALVAGEIYEEYIGEAHAKNQHLDRGVWRIRRITYNATWSVTSITWAERSIDFQFTWSLRATYNYN